MEKMNMWTLLKESSESRNKYVVALHTPYHTYIIPNGSITCVVKWVNKLPSKNGN